MKIGDKISNHPKIQSTNGYSISENALTGRNVEYIKDIEKEPDYEIY